jgi:hypothetical protein
VFFLLQAEWTRSFSVPSQLICPLFCSDPYWTIDFKQTVWLTRLSCRFLIILVSSFDLVAGSLSPVPVYLASFYLEVFLSPMKNCGKYLFSQ